MGAGKTSLFNRFKAENTGINQETIDRWNKVIEIDGTRKVLQIWDTLGLERSNSLGENYYRTSAGVLFVYNMTDMTSANELVQWYNLTCTRLRETQSDPVFFVIGTQSDRKNAIVVNTNKMSNKLPAADIVEYFEISSTTGENFEECITSIAQRVFMESDGVVPNSLNLADQGTNKQNCC